MAKHTSVTLGDHFEQFIAASIASGRYGSASEMVRAAMRLLEEEESKFLELKEAIRQGIESGRAKDSSMEAVLAESRRRRNA